MVEMVKYLWVIQVRLGEGRSLSSADDESLRLFQQLLRGDLLHCGDVHPLSLRQVEGLLFERAIDICHETVQSW